MNTHPVVLITGASSGIGQACAEHLHRQGYRVYGTSRKAPWPSLLHPSEAHPAESFVLLPLDVTQDSSVKQVVGAIWEHEGRLDVVVNNAGVALVGSVEDTSLEEAQAEFDTNFFGVLRVCRAVLPLMRQQQAGCIINISSIAATIGIPFQSVYSASKAALEGLTESLRMEVQPYGIRVVVVQPGDIDTGIAARRQKTEAVQGSIYQERLDRALAVMEKDEMAGPPPETIAHLVEQIIETPHPRVRYIAAPLTEHGALALKKTLPSRVFEWALMKYYDLR